MKKKPGGYVNIKRFQVIFTLSCEKERSLFSIVVSTFDYNSLKTLYRISRRKTEMIEFLSESFYFFVVLLFPLSQYKQSWPSVDEIM